MAATIDPVYWMNGSRPGPGGAADTGAKAGGGS